MNADRPLPNKPDTERAILGAVLVDGKALSAAERYLSSSDFFVSAHKVIFAEMQRQAKNGQPVDLVVLCDALRNDPNVTAAGGHAYVASLGDGVHKNAPVEAWAKGVREAALLRGLALAGESLTNAALEPGATIESVTIHVAAPQDVLARGSVLLHHGLVAIPVEELLQLEVKPREMLLDPILPDQGLAMLYSYRGVGKTLLSIAIAASVASGAHFLRWKAPRPRRVLYVDGELPASTLRDRFAMILAGMELGDPAPADELRIITPDLQGCSMPDLATLEGQRLIDLHLEGIDLLVLDNLSALCRAGDENEGEAWLPVQEWALRLRRAGKSVLFVHHAGKNKSQRGTSRREDLLDTVITLRHPSDYNPSEGLRCELHFEKTRAMLGDAAKPIEVRLSSGADGRAIWTYRELEDAKADKAAGLFAEGLSVREVAAELGISRSQAGRLRQRWTNGESGEPSRRPLA